ncbi:MAG: exodeoxyribonuclease VII large subunit [Thermoplasmata archaeon]|nr:MAG: exodeoxyribonuclease VII large subunit [Thermoplasmata archaeon]
MSFGQRDLGSFMDDGKAPKASKGPEPGVDMSPREPPPREGPEPMTVLEATRIIKDRLTAEPRLQDLTVAGELSNVSRSARGHLYFTLKDADAQMPCVMFSRGGRTSVEVEEGDQVVVTGRIDVYEPHGKYQLLADSITKRGMGDLYKRFLELKARLEKEGLFADELKRPIPRLPRRVGVVTSSTGSVFHDIVRVMRRRYPHVRVTLAHSAVQGEKAAAELVEGLARLNALGDVDVIIIGRGGGSFEDLWPFNDEGLARAIRASGVPVVSAVGHETDFTISDFVADRRAPTPSAAAEMTVPSAVEEGRMLRAHGERLLAAITRRVTRERDRVEGLAARPVLRRPRDMLDTRQQRVDELVRILSTKLLHTMEMQRGRLAAMDERLEALSPVSTLRRGYTLALDAEGRSVGSVAQVSPGDPVELVMADGRVDTRAEKVRPDDDPKR